jgi:hypothetical protein
MRAASNRRLAHEVRKLEAHGLEALVIEPGADDLAVMGTNLMSRARRAEVAEQARRSVALDLRGRDVPRLTGAARGASGRGRRRAAAAA